MIEWGIPDFREEDLEAASSSLGTYIGGNGELVLKFEQEFANKVGAKYAVATNNGTSALVSACMVLKHIHGNLKIGVPNFTFIASANSTGLIFDSMVLLDVDPQTWNVTKRYAKSADAIMTVDVGGLSCDYDSLKELGIPIIADSAEAAGSKYKGNYVGTQALMHCFSLHRSKIISCGEGGIITTNSEECYKLLKSYTNHGYDENRKSYEYKHKTLGLNFRLTDVHAAIALQQLKRLDIYVAHRQEIAKVYDNLSFDTQQYDRKNYLHNYFFYGIQVDPRHRDRIVEGMLGKEIVCKTWSTVSSQQCYQSPPTPSAKKIADSIILLPIHNKLTINDAEKVCEELMRII